MYITEAITPLFDLLRARYPGTIGSEFSAGAKLGEDLRIGNRDVQMQDITQLTFPDQAFQAVLSFDVLEHVPDYRRALAEFSRVLQPRGYLLLSVPFTFAEHTETRATVEPDGSILHHRPPEYHGDPLSSSGVLCFQTFGMDLLTEFEQVGFADSYVGCYSSEKWGYLGANILFAGRKAADR